MCFLNPCSGFDVCMCMNLLLWSCLNTPLPYTIVIKFNSYFSNFVSSYYHQHQTGGCEARCELIWKHSSLLSILVHRDRSEEIHLDHIAKLVKTFHPKLSRYDSTPTTSLFHLPSCNSHNKHNLLHLPKLFFWYCTQSLMYQLCKGVAFCYTILNPTIFWWTKRHWRSK